MCYNVYNTYAIRMLIRILLFLYIPFTLHGQTVMKSGQWYRFAVSERGLYAISYNQLEDAGINPGEINPANLALYGNGGQILDQKNSTDHNGLPEVGVLITGMEDGRFDPNDKIIFYAPGPHKMDYLEDSFYYEKNYYEKASYYFLTVKDTPGKRVVNQDDMQMEGEAFTTFIHHFTYENDEFSFLNSGREWYGSTMSQTSPAVSQQVEVGKLAPEGKHRLISELLGSSFEPSEIDIFVNNELITSINPPVVSDGEYTDKAIPVNVVSDLPTSDSESIEIRYRYTSSSTRRARAYLDYFILEVEKPLEVANEPLYFRHPESYQHPFSTFTITNVHNHIIWDITDALSPRHQQYRSQGQQAVFTIPGGGVVKEFAVFKPEEITTAPAYLGSVENQAVRGTPSSDLLIISHPDFLSAARRLAAHRSKEMTATVVNSVHILNEFGSGSNDPVAIRNFIKYLYDRSGGVSPKYVLLMGDATYDFRQITGVAKGFIPTYPSRNSLHPVFTYSSDDFFAFMEDDEGEWVESRSGDHTMDIGVGRLPVKTVAEANAVVRKLIQYDSWLKRRGEWKTRVGFIADDGDRHLHLRDAEELSVRLIEQDVAFSPRKRYLDAYPQVNSSNRQSSPEFREELLKLMDDGVLILNFTGHGGETSWTDEDIFSMEMIRNLDNEVLPLFVTATCQFGRHDGIITSGAEALLLKPQGGAIALLTTSRPVAASSNIRINRAFYDNIFKKEDNLYRRLGDIVKDTKNESLLGSANRNFILLGDPSMRLAYPTFSVQLDSVQTDYQSDTLSAMSLVTLSGHIQGQGFAVAENFNGEVTMNLYDKEVEKKTLGDEDPATTYKAYENPLFRGSASVVNGRFQMQFRMPKNLTYSFGNGKMHFYAYDEANGWDAGGGSASIAIGGESPNQVSDVKPPVIELFINDTIPYTNRNFSPEVRIFGRISDENGISISRSVGQQMTLIVDDSLRFDVSDFYTASKNDFTTGWLNFPVGRLKAGVHTARLQVWDNFNNPAQQSISFRVGDESQAEVFEIYSQPNPFSDQVSFVISHNRTNEDLEVEVIITNVSGREVDRQLTMIPDAPSRIHTPFLAIDRNLPEGLYFYKVIVRSNNVSLQIMSGGKMIKIK